jgi:TetR/AcrR family transcriptional regulator, regulator of cefoperazone and chloramphenicol sensitivity
MAPRGDKTRSKLLDTATQLFSERGVDAVSTRDIASSAGTTLPSISHHFGSKEGLYQAVLQRVSEEMDEQFSAASAAALKTLANAKSNGQQRLNGLEELICAHARTILQSQSDWASLITAEERLPTGAAKPIDRVVEKHLLHPMVQLIASVTHSSPADPEVRLHAITLLGSVLIFRTRRVATLRLLHWQELTPLRIKQVVEHLRREVQVRFGTTAS